MTDRLKEWLDKDNQAGHSDWRTALAVLRAVVELHKPVGSLLPNLVNQHECFECHGVDWPCPTIRAIEKEVLNG